MKHRILSAVLFAALSSTNTLAHQNICDATSLQAAVASTNADRSVSKIVFRQNAYIILHDPVIYNGGQNLILVGNNAILNGLQTVKLILMII